MHLAPPMVPRRGVGGHYIDRCITFTCLSLFFLLLSFIATTSFLYHTSVFCFKYSTCKLFIKNIGKLAPYENFPLHVIHALCLRTHLFQRHEQYSNPRLGVDRRLALICAKRGISYTRYVHVHIVRLSRPYRRLSPACELMCIKISHHHTSKISA